MVVGSAERKYKGRRRSRLRVVGGLITQHAFVTGSAKTCQDAGIFENPFLAFYNSVVQGDYNALCFTSVACSVAKLRAPPFPCSAEERLE